MVRFLVCQIGVILLLHSAHGQTLTLSLSPSTLPPGGGDAVLTVNWTDTAPFTSVASGFSWAWNLSPGVEVVSGSVIGPSVALHKVLTCTPSRCVLVGSGGGGFPVNQSGIPSGPIGSFLVTVRAIGPVQISLVPVAVTMRDGPATATGIVPSVVPASATVPKILVRLRGD